MPEPERAALSPRQQDALAAVHRLQEQLGRPPTRAELGQAMGVRAQTADFHLRALARKGYLVIERGARAIRAAETHAEASRSLAGAVSEVPLLGAVTAGLPTHAIEHAEGSVPLPQGTQADFALRVKGDSMSGVGILDGDLVLVRRADRARSGQTVVALLGEGETTETTVKTWWQSRGSSPELRAQNPAYPTRVLDGSEAVRLAGIVVGLFRGQEGFGG